jgi:hypothetical protein
MSHSVEEFAKLAQICVWAWVYARVFDRIMKGEPCHL